MDEAFRQFEIDESRLSSSEKKVLEKLVEAARLIGPLYLLQENNQYPGANFYPPDATPSEIEEAAKKDPLILDPYTIVERDKEGDLFAIPYHKKYREYMEPIARLLEEAAKLSEDRRFSEFLRARAKSFLDDSWDKSETLWLEVGDSKLDILIGPIEPYLDNLFSVKCAFQGNVRIRSEDPKFNPRDYLRVIQNIHASSPMVSEGAEQSVRVRVDDVVALAGWHARLCPAGTNLPNDPRKVTKYGTKIIIYTTGIRLREGSITLKALERVFPSDILKNHPQESLLDNAIRATMLHEITESEVKYPGSVERLGDMYTPVKELHASVLGIKSCTFHVLKGILSQQDYEEILMIFISWLFESWLRVKASKGIMSYLRGYVVAFNFFCEHGGLKVENGIIKPDFEKLFVGVDGLSSVLSHLMSSGSQKQAQRFFEQYGSFEIFDEFTPKLKDIPVDL
mgnify:CR=1 FL=1